MQQDLRIACEFQSFTSLSQLNESVKHFRYEYGHEINENTNRVLDYISRHSTKIFGVAWLKNKTIAKALDVSLSTVQRAIRKLVHLGILNRIDQFNKEKNNAQAQNLYVILPFVSFRLKQKSEDQNQVTRGGDMGGVTWGVDAQTPEMTDVSSPSEPPETQSSLNSIISDGIDIRNRQVDIPDHLPKEYTKEIVPEYFRNLGIFSGPELSMLYDRVLKAAKQVGGKLYKRLLDQETIVQAFQEMVVKHKHHEIRDGKSFEALCKFFYGILRVKFAVLGNALCEKYWKAVFAGQSVLDDEQAILEMEQRIRRLAEENDYVRRSAYAFTWNDQQSSLEETEASSVEQEEEPLFDWESIANSHAVVVATEYSLPYDEAKLLIKKAKEVIGLQYEA